jgi:PPOX class probable F420-dependent enzyme
MPRTAIPRPPARVARFLETEEVIWLSTVTPEGLPRLVPIWFSWDGRSVLIVSKPGAGKVDNIRASERVMLALGDAEEDFDIALIEGRAELPDLPPEEFLPPSHFRKYARDLESIGLSREEYLATYCQPIRVVPIRFLGWHGRTPPRSAPRRRFAARTGSLRARAPRQVRLARRHTRGARTGS